MTDEFDRVLRESLQRRADDAGHVDLTDGAITRAGRIRRRRRLTAGVGVIAVVALAVPVGIQVADQGREHTASRPTDEDASAPDTVTLAGLASGPPPAVPYIEGQTFHSGDRSVELPTTNGSLTDAVAVPDGALVWITDTSSGKASVVETPSNDIVSRDATSPAVGPDHGEAAWAAASGAGEPHGEDQVVVVSTADGNPRASGAAGQDVLQVMGVSDGVAVFNARVGKERSVGQVSVSTGVASTAWPSATYVTAVDSRLRRMVGHTTDPNGGDEGCLTVTDTDLQDDDWVTCEWRPVEFSADGSELLAIRPGTDGLGPRELAVLDSVNGDVRQVLSTDGTFGRATFEGSESVMAVLAEGDRAAIVRCPIDGGACELATKPAAVVPDDPSALISPYQLTAN